MVVGRATDVVVGVGQGQFLLLFQGLLIRSERIRTEDLAHGRKLQGVDPAWRRSEVRRNPALTNDISGSTGPYENTFWVVCSGAGNELLPVGGSQRADGVLHHIAEAFLDINTKNA